MRQLKQIPQERSSDSAVRRAPSLNIPALRPLQLFADVPNQTAESTYRLPTLTGQKHYDRRHMALRCRKKNPKFLETVARTLLRFGSCQSQSRRRQNFA